MNEILYKNLRILTVKDGIDLSKTYFWLSSFLSSDSMSSNPDSCISYYIPQCLHLKKKDIITVNIIGKLRGLDKLIQLKILAHTKSCWVSSVTLIIDK